jgi:hypothetical protein
MGNRAGLNTTQALRSFDQTTKAKHIAFQP